MLGPRPAHPPPAAASAAAASIDAEELKRRTEFLKAQRDKVSTERTDDGIVVTNRHVSLLAQLLAMKKEEREKQLFEAEKQQMKSRPKSARAARSAFGECTLTELCREREDSFFLNETAGKGRAGGGGGGGGAGGLDPQTLKVRRALAEKLKQEVVGKH